MKYKVGDKVYCKREYYKCRTTHSGAHSTTIFYPGKWYDIVGVNEKVIIVKCENTNHEKFVLDNIYFTTIKELRKMKLEKIKENETI